MITVSDYSMQLGDFRLDDINLKIEDGEIFALIGESGAGKTILLEAMAGFHGSDAGAVYYENTPVRQIPLGLRKVGFVYQDLSLFPNMTVRQNVEFGLKMKGMSGKQRHKISNNIMKELKIYDICERFPESLSGGEKQRTALARSIVLKPRILFMDEPFSALDPATRLQMYDLIKYIHASCGCTIVFVTHNFEEAQLLADRVGILLGGRLRKVCGSAELFADNFDSDVMNFLGMENRLDDCRNII